MAVSKSFRLVFMAKDLNVFPDEFPQYQDFLIIRVSIASMILCNVVLSQERKISYITKYRGGRGEK